VDVLTSLASDPLCRALPVLVAPFIGSFMGVLILRLPEGRPVLAGRSVCERCARRLGLADLVPLLSYVLSRGRCRHCGDPIARIHLLIELAALVVAAGAVTARTGGDVWLACLLGWTLLTAAWIDARTMILPDILTLPLLAVGLVVAAIAAPDAVMDRAAAAGLGYLLLFATARAYRRLRGRAGLGLGDAKLLAALGAWVGLSDLPAVLVLACCLGLVAAGVLALSGRQVTATTAIPFGPFLSAAGWVWWLYADCFSVRVWDDAFGLVFAGA
jgi:leader peptidase (prepilin peptidase)/N-methyltransferase